MRLIEWYTLRRNIRESTKHNKIIGIHDSINSNLPRQQPTFSHQIVSH